MSKRVMKSIGWASLVQQNNTKQGHIFLVKLFFQFSIPAYMCAESVFGWVPRKQTRPQSFGYVAFTKGTLIRRSLQGARAGGGGGASKARMSLG